MILTKKRQLRAVPVGDLVPYARNPRKNSAAVKSVAASLEEFGLVKNSIVVDDRMCLITGHTTLAAAKSLGWKTIPEVTQVFWLTDAQKRAYRIADNRLGEMAEWDAGLLAGELADLDAMGADISMTGMPLDEISALLDPEEKEYSLDDFVFDGPDVPCWFVLRGDQEQYQEIYEAISEVAKRYGARLEASGDDDETR